MKNGIVLLALMMSVFYAHAQFGKHAYYNYSGSAMKFSANTHRTGESSGYHGLFEIQWGEGFGEGERFAVAGFGHHGIGGGYTKGTLDTDIYFRVYEELGFLFMYSISPDLDLSVSVIPSYLDLCTEYVVWGLGVNAKVRYGRLMTECSFVPVSYKELRDPGYFFGAANYGFSEEWMVGLRMYHSQKTQTIGLCFTKAV
ncbi:MAG: hypothetical protein ACOYLH_09210 [Flavobacteriales bacterium]